MLRKAVAIYSIIVGISMLAAWTMFYLTGAIPELQTEPARIILHITAELVTGISLIVAGFALITFKKWGYEIYLLATGALLYTLIQSPGYYLQMGELGFVAMFTVLFVLTIILLLMEINLKDR